ncbi:hypothetical protein GQ44DRAFT_553488, partial [Phaeosphaeriaceae sp. PMI808]
ILLADKRMSRKVLRKEALGPAIRSGRLDVVQRIFDQCWGPVDFINTEDYMADNIAMGMLHTPLSDFCHQPHAFPESRRTSLYPITLKKMDINDLLDDVSFYSPQRVDVATWLLDHGAMVQEKESPGKRMTLRSRGPSEREETKHESRKPWNPLRRAVKGGNEKIVRLLLERGAN